MPRKPRPIDESLPNRRRPKDGDLIASKTIREQLNQETKEPLSLAITRISSTVLADIRKIRILWSQGWADIEIRKALDLNWTKWHVRLRIMKAVPPDEDIFTSYKRFYLEHTKFVSRQEKRLQDLNNTLKISQDRNNVQEIAAILSQMGVIDERIRLSEVQLIGMKKSLGIISDNDLGNSDKTGSPFALDTVLAAWQQIKMVSGDNGTSIIEQEDDAEIVNQKSNGKSNGIDTDDETTDIDGETTDGETS